MTRQAIGEAIRFADSEGYLIKGADTDYWAIVSSLAECEDFESGDGDDISFELFGPGGGDDSSDERAAVNCLAAQVYVERHFDYTKTTEFKSNWYRKAVQHPDSDYSWQLHPTKPHARGAAQYVVIT